MQGELMIWSWIEDAKASGVKTWSPVEAVAARVQQLRKEHQARLADEYLTLQKGADRLVVWEACSLLLGCTASDDSFEYFRNWLIWGGEQFFISVMTKTDLLADTCRAHGIDLSNPFFEALGVLGEFEGSPSDPAKGVPPTAQRDWSWLESSAAKIAEDLPNLWGQYGSAFMWDPPTLPQASSFEAPGLGTLRVGDRVRHKFGYGEGTVTEVLEADTSLATIKFSDASRPFRITSAHFELAK